MTISSAKAEDSFRAQCAEKSPGNNVGKAHRSVSNLNIHCESPSRLTAIQAQPAVESKGRRAPNLAKTVIIDDRIPHGFSNVIRALT
jgi:hypothetical protein